MHKSSKDVVTRTVPARQVMLLRHGIQTQKFDINFKLTEARIDSANALLAAFAACLSPDEHGKLRIDAARRTALLTQYVLQATTPSGELYQRVAVGKLLITADTWYQTPVGVRESSYDELGYLNANHKLLVIERWSKDEKIKGLQLLGGGRKEGSLLASGNSEDRHVIATDSASEKISFINGYRVAGITEQERLSCQRRLSGMLSLDPHFVATAILDQAALQTLAKEYRLAPQVVAFYENALYQNRQAPKAKEIGALELPVTDSFVLPVSSARLLELVDNDQRFYCAVKGAKVRLRIISLLDALYPQAWLDRHEFYHSIVPQLFDTLGRNKQVFKAYLRQATQRIIEMLQADIVAARWPVGVDMTQSLTKVMQQWLAQVQIDFAGHIKANRQRYEQDYVMCLDMTKSELLAFNHELLASAEQAAAELMPLLAEKLARPLEVTSLEAMPSTGPEQHTWVSQLEQIEQGIALGVGLSKEARGSLHSATTLSYWGIEESPAAPLMASLSEAAPPCELHCSDEAPTDKQVELIGLGQQVRIQATANEFILHFRLQRGGVASTVIADSGLGAALRQTWQPGKTLARHGDLWWRLVREVIVPQGGCYPARYATPAPMDVQEHLQDIVLVRAARRPEFAPGFDLELALKDGWIATPHAFFAALLACVTLDEKGAIAGIDVAKRIQLVDRLLLQRDAQSRAIGTRFIDIKKGETFSAGMSWLGIEYCDADSREWLDVRAYPVRTKLLQLLQKQGWLSPAVFEFFSKLSDKIGDAYADIFYLPVSAEARLRLSKLADTKPTQHEIAFRMRLLQPKELELIAVDAWYASPSPEGSGMPAWTYPSSRNTNSGCYEVIYSQSGQAYGWRDLTTSVIERDKSHEAQLIEPEEYSVLTVTHKLSRYLGDKRAGNRYAKAEDEFSEEVINSELNYLANSYEKLEVLNRLYTQHLYPNSSSLYTHTTIGAGFFYDTNTHCRQLSRLREKYQQLVTTHMHEEQVVATVNAHLQMRGSLLSSDATCREVIRELINPSPQARLTVG